MGRKDERSYRIVELGPAAQPGWCAVFLLRVPDPLPTRYEDRYDNATGKLVQTSVPYDPYMNNAIRTQHIACWALVEELPRGQRFLSGLVRGTLTSLVPPESLPDFMGYAETEDETRTDKWKRYAEQLRGG